MTINPVDLTADLVKCASVTPVEGGALVLLQRLLSDAGFTCTRVDRGEVSNLFARWGNGKTLGFNGHTDVVPVGDLDAWTVDPFGAEIKDGFLYGRGSTDMKSGVAAFAAAAIDFVSNTHRQTVQSSWPSQVTKKAPPKMAPSPCSIGWMRTAKPSTTASSANPHAPMKWVK